MGLIVRKKVLIIGLGLLGGSYAMALKKKGFYVSAISSRQKTIDYAIEKGLIDYGTTEIDEKLIGDAELVIFAVYPNVFIRWVEQNGHLFQPGTVITDVTGVKGSVVYKIQEMLPCGVEFIAAHPMAGREVGGVENSDDAIFQGANYIVVPTENNTKAAIEQCKDLGNILGFANVSVLSPEKHDQMIAFLSQLTHCIAVSLMCSKEDPDLVQYTGDSFRDLTRIAKINDVMWSELFLENRSALLKEMDNYRQSFDNLYECIKNNDVDGIRQMMQISTARRKNFDR